MTDYQPILVRESQVKTLRKQGVVVIDDFTSQVEELFLVRNPSLRFKLKNHWPKDLATYKHVWFYYPWRNSAVRLLTQQDFFELRTARNHNLITAREQAQIRQTKIGVIGLSVGNSIVTALGLEGFENFYLADGDTLGLSNLNRIKASLVDLGLNKSIIAARQIYELNPYARVKVFPTGIKNIAALEKFIKNLDVIVDEMDDVAMKIQLRLAARKHKKPVISAADNGDGAVLDIERFDLEPTRAIYHGLLQSFPYDKMESLSFAQKFELINRMVGVEYVVPRMKESLLEVGKTLYSWPQLGAAAQLSGATIAYLAKGIVLREKIASGKYDVNLERIFLKDFDSKKNQTRRAQATRKFLKLQTVLFKK